MAFTKIAAAGIGTTETVTVDGLTVINNGSFGGNLTVGGVLTYEDVTNVDSVGLITARNGIVVGSGITLSKDGDIFFTGIMTGNGSGLTGVANTDVIFTDKLQVGDSPELISVGVGSDLQIYHNPNSSYIDNNTGHLFIRNNVDNDDGGNIYLQAKSGENGIIVNDDGAVQIYHDNSQTLVTSSTGVTLTGKLNVGTAATLDASGLSVTAGIITATSATFTGDITLNSTDKKIYLSNDSDQYITANAASNYMVFATANAEKLRITSGGVIQCGTSGTLKAEINNSVSGHQFISQCDDNNNGFEIYQLHGSTATRNTLAVYDNRGNSGAKQLAFAVRGDGLTVHQGAICMNSETSTANQLDDYEEGTYVATIYGSSTGTGSPFGMNPTNLRYTKVGRVVHVTGRVYINSSSNNPAGSARMLLPFTSATNGSGHDGQAYSYVTRYNVYSPNNDWNLCFEVEPNASYGVFLWDKPGASWDAATADGHINQNAAYYGFDFSYTTAT